MASVAAGTTYGVAKGATIHSIRAEYNCTRDVHTDDAAAGIDWVVANHATSSVLNISISGPLDCDLFGCGDLFEDEVQEAIDEGITVVIAAGNEGGSACNYTPARISDAITVAATNSSDERATWGGQSSAYGSCVDIWAPGTGIATAITGVDSLQSGTSIAAPFVSGAAAIYLDQFPTADHYQVAVAMNYGATKNELTNIGAGSPNVFLWSNLPGWPDVSIVGPSETASAGYCTWTTQLQGGAPSITYSWSGVLSAGNTGVLNGSVSTSGWLYVNVTDGRGRTAQGSLYITVNEQSNNCPF